MRSTQKISCVLLLVVLISTITKAAVINSPGMVLTLQVTLNTSGAVVYELKRGNKDVIENSRLGFALKGLASLNSDFEIVSTEIETHDDTWIPVWGETKTIRNHYNALTLTLRQKTSEIILKVIFRLFDDGLGFRYEFPEQPNLKYFIIENELTEFHLTGDHTAFWIPGDYDTNEYGYSESLLSEIHALAVSKKYSEISTRVPIGDNFVQTPLMMKTADGLYINIHEAALVNYAAMQLEVDQKQFILRASLVPDAVGNCVYASTPFKTPWRTIVVSDKATDILASRIILNLNEPSVIENTTWIHPLKYIGIWWEMHVGVATWNYSNTNNIDIATTNWNTLTPNGKHGATTERTKYYIDFAAANGLDAVLIEGWDVGWEDWFGKWKENVFDFVTPYPDFNVEQVKAYAASKHIQLIMHHETSGSVGNYERRLADAIAFMNANNYKAVKTGYVGMIIPRGEHHDGQYMVNHYLFVANQMAKNNIMVDAHEPVRPTGLQRTYPNWLACEAARGNEFNAWSQGNAPDHETILPFTRLMGGPMDYTPGIFEIKMSYYDPSKNNQVHTTLAKQLALYVTIYSPLQMAADLPENYLKHMDAFQFIKDVAVDWDDTKYIEAEPGNYLTIARKAKGKENWFVGSITDENARNLKLRFDFLSPNKTYEATIYADAKNADWKINPMAYVISKQIISSKDIITVPLAPGGGCAISIIAQ